MTVQSLIEGGLMITAAGREPVAGGVVAIDDAGRIAAVGPPAEGSARDGAERIDARGCSVLPGLVDTHVHVLIQAHRRGLAEGDAALWGSNYIRAALESGVTTLRDLGTRYGAIFGLKRALAAGWIVGPRLLASGAGICMTGGHSHDDAGIEADGPDAVRRVAREQIKAGADAIKLLATGGAGSLPGTQPMAPQLTVDEMRGAVEVAHRAGKPVAAHAHSVPAIVEAVEAGVDTIEHGIYLDQPTAELLARRGVSFSPTLSVYPRIVQAADSGIAPAYFARNAEPMIAPHRQAFQHALAAGVRIVLGTDCGNTYHPLGDVALELELWVQAGMPPLAAIEAATRHAAVACGVGDDTGTLEVGKCADILIVEGDVVHDIGALNRVRVVMRDGKVVHDARVSLPIPPPPLVAGPRPPRPTSPTWRT